MRRRFGGKVAVDNPRAGVKLCSRPTISRAISRLTECGRGLTRICRIVVMAPMIDLLAGRG